MAFPIGRTKPVDDKIKALDERLRVLERNSTNVPPAASGAGTCPEQTPSADDMEELRGLRTAISMMGLDPKKVAELALGGPPPVVEPMTMVYARILFSSLEPNPDKLRQAAGEKTRIESWLANWKRLAADTPTSQ